MPLNTRRFWMVSVINCVASFEPKQRTRGRRGSLMLSDYLAVGSSGDLMIAIIRRRGPDAHVTAGEDAGATFHLHWRTTMRGMQTADVVIVGGGIVGSSIAYHLTEQGCRDVIVVEREAHVGK